MAVAILSGNVEQVRSLAQQGLDLDQEQGNGTMLHFAVTEWPPDSTEEGRLPVIEELLRLGASINAPDPAGGTPMDAAHFARKPSIVSFLASRGGRHQIKDEIEARANEVMRQMGYYASPKPAPPAAGSGCLASFLIAGLLCLATGWALVKYGVIKSPVVASSKAPPPAAGPTTTYGLANTSPFSVRVEIKRGDSVQEVELEKESFSTFEGASAKETVVAVYQRGKDKPLDKVTLKKDYDVPLLIKVGSAPVATADFRSLYQEVNNLGMAWGKKSNGGLMAVDVKLVKSFLTPLGAEGENIHLCEPGEPLPKKTEDDAVVRVEIFKPKTVASLKDARAVVIARLEKELAEE